MTERVKQMYELSRNGRYKENRIKNESYDLTELFLSEPERYESLAFRDMLTRETPFLLEGDIFGFNRRNVYCPHYFEGIKKGRPALET